MSIDEEVEQEPKGGLLRRPEIPGDGFEFRIQLILAQKEQTWQQWREEQAGNTTAYLTDGSVWPEEEQTNDVDPSSPVVRYLVKWHGLSYMHVSWETEAMLLKHVQTFKKYLRKFQDKMSHGEDIFDDLRLGEHFPATFLQVSKLKRVVDVVR